MSVTYATADAAQGGVTPGRAWTRLTQLFDADSARPIGGQAAPEVETATGTVRGVPTLAYSTEPSVRGGALSHEGCARIVEVIDRARLTGRCVVGVWHSGGASLHEGVVALEAVGRLFRAIVGASGRAPQISVILGPAAGGAAYGPALTDLVVMERQATLFVTGPGVVRDVTGEDVDGAGLGGAAVHERDSGVAHLVRDGEPAALAAAADLVGLLADQGSFPAEPSSAGHEDLSALLPESRRRAYDVRVLVDRILDAPATVLHPRWAPNVLTALGRLEGRTVGVLANNPLRLGGCLDARAGDKAARFVRLCDTFGIPLVVVVDVPGYLPGVGQERDGVVRRGAKLLHAFAACQVSRVTLITRKAYGGAFIAMNSRSLGATEVYAWPGADVDVMNAESALRVLHRRRLAAIDDERRRAETLAELTAGYLAGRHGLRLAVDEGIVTGVVDPCLTRPALVAALARGPSRPATLANIPL